MAGQRGANGRFPKGSGIPAKGKGWGGPAKGEGKDVPLDEVRHLRVDPANLADKAALAEEMRLVLYTVALTGENDHVRIAAADKLLDRVEGKSIARSVSATVDDVSKLTDLELAAEIARLERELGEGAAGASEAEAGKPPGGVQPLH